jgi:hypothetical protein
MVDETVSTTDLKEKAYTELLPPEGDPRLGHRVFQILGEILKDKEDLGLPAKWHRYYELAKNRHWRSSSKKVNLISANLLHTHRQRTVNMLTDNNPTFNIARIGPQDDPELAEKYDSLLRTAEYWWNEEEQQSVFEFSVNKGETYGCTIEKSQFNPDREAGLGEIETLVVDCFHFGFYPTRCQDLQKCDAVLHFEPITVRQARRLWPEYADQIRPDKEILKELGDDRREIIAGSGKDKGLFTTIAGVIKNLISDAGNETSKDNQELLVVECWVRDYTMIVDEEGNEKPKYKGFIRCVTVCNGGNLVVSDRDNPSINPLLPEEEARKTYLWDKFPFSMRPSVTDTETAWGMSDYEQLQQLQEEVDKTLSQIGLYKDKASRLKIINPKDSGIDNSQFTTGPGILNPTNAMVSQAIRYMDPPQMPADLWKVLDIYKDFFFLVAGTFDLEQAQSPGRDVIAYKAIAALLEHASTMLRGKIRNYSRLIRERGRMMLSHVMNWYTEERWITYKSENGQDSSKSIKGPDLIVPAKLTVVSGSTMPRSQIQEREEAISLYDKGAIDAEELLKKMDWPDWKNVIHRMQAGPLAHFVDRLRDLGFPDEVLAVFQEIGQLEDRDFDKAVKDGEIPMIDDLLAPILSPNEGEPGAAGFSSPSPEELEARKVDADIRLVEAKVETEKVKQELELAKIDIEREKLKFERAKVADGFITGGRTQDREDVKVAQAEAAQKDKSQKETSEKKGK